MSDRTSSLNSSHNTEGFTNYYSSDAQKMKAKAIVDWTIAQRQGELAKSHQDWIEKLRLEGRDASYQNSG
ncbi:hypothetical protein ACSYAD_30310 [Acaryochloris marina NIES-2412]|uniref:hypothetical protein n=1 Tax=Acaryochloris marina TaxID=155978 RepID=UPI004058B34E